MAADAHTKGNMYREGLLKVMAGYQSFKHELKKHAPYRPGQSKKDSSGSGYVDIAGSGMATCFVTARSHMPTVRVASVSLLDAVNHPTIDSTPPTLSGGQMRVSRVWDVVVDAVWLKRRAAY